MCIPHNLCTKEKGAGRGDLTLPRQGVDLLWVMKIKNRAIITLYLDIMLLSVVFCLFFLSLRSLRFCEDSELKLNVSEPS